MKDVCSACSHNPLNIGIFFLKCESRVKELITQTWKEWINGLLCVKNNSYDKVSIFFGQKEGENPTCGWIQLGHELNQSNIKLSLIVKTDTAKAEKPDRYSYPQHLFVFDRHFDGYPEVQNDQTKMCFHAAFDKSSSDFVPIFSSTPSDIMFCQLAESAYLNILIMDERVAQVAHNEILSGEKDKPIKLYHSKKRLVVGKFSNVFIATHLKINGQDMALHTDIKKNYPRICVDVKIGRSANTRITNFKVCYHANGNETEKITPHALIIHQGVLERFFYEKVPKNPGETYKVTLKALLEDFRQFVPHILVDSGRGISPNLPDDVKFMPFSLVEDYLMKDSIAKFCLTRVLMSFVRRGANHVKQ